MGQHAPTLQVACDPPGQECKREVECEVWLQYVHMCDQDGGLG